MRLDTHENSRSILFLPNSKLVNYSPYRSKIFKLKVVHHGFGVLTVFRRGSKLLEYCKTCKTYEYIADWKILKKNAKRLTLMGSQSQKF